MKINVNARVRVKLTEAGRKILKKYPSKMYLSNWDGVTGCYTSELWDVMSTFGSAFYMGNTDLPFEGNEIEILSVS